MRYSQTFIDDLRRQTDIVRVIQDYVPLKKKGKDWMACCPFHKEKTPSFSVVPAKEIFYCFGCHKGGSVFNFVMEIESVPFPEAIKIVAEKSGVALPRIADDAQYDTKRQEADEVIELNGWALEWWEQQLEQTTEARTAREYLSQREIKDETRKIFRLGYAPDRWEALSSHLRQKGATQSQIERSGLVVKKDDGGSYDRFRDRLIIPVIDVRGRPIAFGGRTLKRDDAAKYINSPETAAYTKGRNLFGLHLTRDEIRGQGYARLVEGFLDVILPYQLGIRNVVASLGTALTPEQARQLGRFARKVVVHYDGDQAGVKAAKRAIEILLAEDFEIEVLRLDEYDPDQFAKELGRDGYDQVESVSSSTEFITNEFIAKYGANAYFDRVGEQKPYIQFLIDQAGRDRDLLKPAERAEAVKELLPFIGAVRSRIQKREYFDIAMDSLNIQDAALKRELWHAVRSPVIAADLKQKLLRSSETKPTVAEQRLLELLFADEQLRREILAHLNSDDYADLPTASIFQALLDLDRDRTAVDYQSLSARTEGDPVASELLPMLLMGDSSIDEQNRSASLTAASDCIDTLRGMKFSRRIDKLRIELAAAERNGDTARLVELSKEQIELTRLRGALRSQADAGSYGH